MTPEELDKRYDEYVEDALKCRVCGKIDGNIDKEYLKRIIVNQGDTSDGVGSRRIITFMLAICPNCKNSWRVI